MLFLRSAGSSNPIAPLDIASRPLHSGRRFTTATGHNTNSNLTYLWKNSPNVLCPSVARSTETLAGCLPAYAAGGAIENKNV